jgi:cytochrome c5
MARAALSAVLSAVLSALLGGCLAGDRDMAAGERVFVDSGCGNCHTLGAADARGKVGPNLDQLKPDVKTVVAQVTNGGNGMPAFGGKLSSAEILELAGYVKRAAAGGVPVNVKFVPDRTRIAECSSKQPSCYEQAYGNVTYRRGPRVALRRLGSDMASDPTIERNCHRIAHAMGRAGLARLGDPGRAFAQGSAVCWSGYYHGILEGGFAGTAGKDLAKKARSLCSDPSLRRDRFLLYQCVHGLGHGLMLITAYDLPRALGTCSRLATHWDQQSCVSGVFMENFSSFYQVRSKWLRSDDLLYPCGTVARRHKYYCYDQVTSRVLRKVHWNWHRTARICRGAERDWVGVCFESFGRDVSSVVRDDRRRAIELCRIAGRNMTDCVYAVARDIVNEDAGRYRRALRFCLGAPLDLRPRCFNGIGTVVAVLEESTPRRRATCRRLSRRWASACIAGTEYRSNARSLGGRRDS